LKKILIVLLFAAAASAQPFVFAPANPVSQPRIGSAASSFGTMRIASDGTNLLLVWTDDRGSLPAHSNAGSRYGTFLTRVDGQGNVLDVPNIELPGFGEAWPFWDGQEYIVAGSSGKYVRMSAAGEMLDAAPRTIAQLPRGTIVDMVWSGGRILVVGRRRTGDTSATKLYVTMYDHAFNVVRGEFLLESSPGGYSGDIRVATNGRQFLIARNTSGYCFKVTALDAEGSILRETMPLSCDTYSHIWIASDGLNYLLLHDTRPGQVDYQWDYRGVFLSDSGEFLGNAGPFGGGNILSTYQQAALTWEGDSYQFVYPHGTWQTAPGSDDQFVLLAVTIDQIGNSYNRLGDRLQSLAHRPIPFGITATGEPGKRIVMTLGSDSYSTSDPWSWKGRIYASPAQYATAPAFAAGQGVLPQESPASATAGDVSLLAWREADNGSSAFPLVAARVDSHGRTLDATPLRLAAVTCDDTTPRVVTNGRDFFVAWREGPGVKARRVGRDGSLPDAAPITVFKDDQQRCAATPAVAWNGSDYLVAWAGPGPGVSSGASAVRVRPDGTLHDELPIRIAAADGLAHANVASDGKDFFVAWETPQNVAFGARVTAAGTAAGATSLGVEHPSLILWTGTSYAVLSADADGLRAVRADRNGQLVDQQPFLFAAPIDARNAQGSCDATGCYVFGIADGLVVSTRIEETPSALIATSTPLARTDGAWQQMIVFGANRTQFGYLEPYLSSYHLFTTQLLPARGHAVRSRP